MDDGPVSSEAGEAGPGQRVRAIAGRLRQVEARLAEAEALHAVLTRARNAYIADLRVEIVGHRSGVDLGGLLDGEE